MTEVEQPPQNGIDLSAAEDDDNSKARPADIEQDMREMERRKRVEAIMSSKLFREELERIVDSARDSGTSGILQQLSDIVGMPASRVGSVFKSSNCMMPINDIRGVESMGYAKGEKILRCKLAATFRLLDLYGWTQGLGAQITARLKVDQEYFLVNPYGLMYHEITASSLNKVDMQGQIVEQGTTNFGVNKSHFVLHSVVHAARPDIRCAIYIGASPVVAISSLKSGLLPLTKDACVLGEITTHAYTGALLDIEERDRLVRNLGPNSKVLLLSNYGALCCGETIEEAFFAACHIVQACETQLKLLPVGLDNLVLIPEESRKTIYEQSRRPPEDLEKKFAAIATGDEPAAATEEKEKEVPRIGAAPKWRVGGAEFEALMRMLDNAGFRTGYIYRHPLIKSDPPKPKNDVELPPAVSSLGYLLEEEELFRQGIWKKGELRKGGDRSRWLNSPNVYQKVEVLETGTPDPKKITKWVAEGSPTHSTPVRIEDPLQFVPVNTNPKEFKRLQQQIKDNRRADIISAGPQSHILEGVTWDEANRIKDATVSQAGDHVVLMGAASKGIIQRGFQHNATVYKAPYAKNPFDNVTDDELNEYKRTVERKKKSIHGEYTDTDFSESEALSSLQTSGAQQTKQTTTTTTAAVSQSEPEDVSEHQVIRIQTQQAPMPSQAEVVLSDATLSFINGERSHTAVNKKPPTGRDIDIEPTTSSSAQECQIANELISKLNKILEPNENDDDNDSNNNDSKLTSINNNSGNNKENISRGQENFRQNSPLMTEMHIDPLFRKQREKNVRKQSPSQGSPANSNASSAFEASPPPVPPSTPLDARVARESRPTSSSPMAAMMREKVLATSHPHFCNGQAKSWFDPLVRSTCCVLRAGGCLDDDGISFGLTPRSPAGGEFVSLAVPVDTPRPKLGVIRSGKRPAIPILPPVETLTREASSNNNNNLYSVCYERGGVGGRSSLYGSEAAYHTSTTPTTSHEYEDIDDGYKKSIFCCTPTICETILQSISQPLENDLILNIPFTVSAAASSSSTTSSPVASRAETPRRGSRSAMSHRSPDTVHKSPYRTTSHFGFNSPSRDPQPDHKHVPKSPRSTKTFSGPGKTLSYEGIFSSPRFVDLCENCFDKMIRQKPELLQMRTRLRNLVDLSCPALVPPIIPLTRLPHHQHPHPPAVAIVNLHDGYESVSSGSHYDYIECGDSEPSYVPFYSQLETVEEVEEPASSESQVQGAKSLPPLPPPERSRCQSSSFIDKIMSMNYSEESTNINFAVGHTPLSTDITLALPGELDNTLVAPPDVIGDTEDSATSPVEAKRLAALVDQAKRNTTITEIWDFGNWQGLEEDSKDEGSPLVRRKMFSLPHGDGDKSLTDTESALNLHQSEARENLLDVPVADEPNNSGHSGSSGNTTGSSRRRLDFSSTEDVKMEEEVDEESAQRMNGERANAEQDQGEGIEADQEAIDLDVQRFAMADEEADEVSPPDSGVDTCKRVLMGREERMRRKAEFQELWEDHVAYFTNREQVMLSDTESSRDLQQQQERDEAGQHSDKSSEKSHAELVEVLVEECYDTQTYVFRGPRHENADGGKAKDNQEDNDKDGDDKDDDDNANPPKEDDDDDNQSTHSTQTYQVGGCDSRESLVKSSDTIVGSATGFQTFYGASNVEMEFRDFLDNISARSESIDLEFQDLTPRQPQTASSRERVENAFDQIVDEMGVEKRPGTPRYSSTPVNKSKDEGKSAHEEGKSTHEEEVSCREDGNSLSSVERKILHKIEKHRLNRSEEIFDKIEATIRNKKTFPQAIDELKTETDEGKEEKRESHRPRLSRSLNSESPVLASKASPTVTPTQETGNTNPKNVHSAPELKSRTKRNFILENIRKASTPLRRPLVAHNPRAVFGKNPFGLGAKKAAAASSIRNLIETQSESDSAAVFSFQNKERSGSSRIWVTMATKSSPSPRCRAAKSSVATMSGKRLQQKTKKQATFIVGPEDPHKTSAAAASKVEVATELETEISLLCSLTVDAFQQSRLDEQIDELGVALQEAAPLVDSCSSRVQEIGDNLSRCNRTVDECIAEQNELSEEFQKFSETLKLSQYAERISCMVNCSLTEEDLKGCVT